MPTYVYQVHMHVPEGAELPEADDMEQTMEETLNMAHEKRLFPGVSHVEVNFEDCV